MRGEEGDKGRGDEGGREGEGEAQAGQRGQTNSLKTDNNMIACAGKYCIPRVCTVKYTHCYIEELIRPSLKGGLYMSAGQKKLCLSVCMSVCMSVVIKV